MSSLTRAAPRKAPSTETRPPASSVPPSTGPEERRQQPILTEIARHRGNRGAGARDDHQRGDARQHARQHVAQMNVRPTRTPESSAAAGSRAGGEHFAAERRQAVERGRAQSRRAALTISSGET